MVNVGTGPYATTDEEFGDLELLIEYKTVPHADSGNLSAWKSASADLGHNQPSLPDKPDRNPNRGSGGLFNNTPKSPAEIRWYGRTSLSASGTPSAFASGRTPWVGSTISLWLTRR